MTYAIKQNAALHAGPLAVRPVHQLTAMAWYEFKMHWQRRALRVVTLTSILCTIAPLLILADFFTGPLPAIQQLSLLPVEQQRMVPGLVLFMFSAGSIPLLMMFLLPIAVADTVPLDNEQQMDELMDSLPLTPAIYLAGKVSGLWLVALSSGLITLIGIGVFWWLKTGPYHPGPYLDMWLAAALPLLLLKSGAGLLLGATQPTRRRAGVLVLMVFGGLLLVDNSMNNALNPLLNPAPYAVVSQNFVRAFEALAHLPVMLPPSNLAAPELVQALAAGAVQLTVIWLAVWGWMKRKQ